MAVTIPETWKRNGAFGLLLIIYVLWLFSLYRRQTGGMDDFDIFFKAGERLMNGENIYGPPHYYNLKYFYSVLFAGIMALFNGVELQTVKWFWFLLNTALFVRVLLLLRSELWSGEKKAPLLLFFLLLLTGKMVLVNYTFNQISVLILWTMAESYRLMKAGKPFAAAFILCLGINIKIMPVVLAPLYLLMSEKPLRLTLYGTGLLVFFALVPALFVGWEHNLFLLGEWWKTLNPVSEIHVMQTYEYGFTDISSMVTKYLSAQPVYNEPDIHLADLSMRSLFLITNALRIILLIPAVWMAFRLRGEVCGMDGRFLGASAFMALIPLCFPHQREYSFMFFIPLLASLFTLMARTGGWKHILIFAALALWAGMLTWEDFTGRALLDIFRHYRLITMGMTGIYLFYILLLRKEMKTGKKVTAVST